MAKEMFQRADLPNDIEFSINGKKHTISDKFPVTTSLNDYIRDQAGLKGTKVMCKEAGCGCCAVAVTYASDGNKAETMSINSCLCPLYSVDGWQISTVEGIGNQRDGFHPIQERIAKYNGTQCGYCTPGFVMSMYGLMHQKPNATQQDIEDSFDGHLCRCTGYRSILDAMKSFASDSNGKEKALDIEDLNKHLCPKTGELCKSKDKQNGDNGSCARNLELSLNGSKWYRPMNMKSLTKILQQHKTHSVQMLFGNTASGIFKYQGPFEVYIDLRAVAELHQCQETKKSIIIGAGTTLTKLMTYMKNQMSKPGYHYCKGILRHLKVIASVLVRNAGSIAGNLMIKHENQWFPSDVFTWMEGVGGKVHIVDSKGCCNKVMDLMEFLKTNMKGKVIVAVELPQWNANEHYRSYKITPRWQNAHAYVNAAFKIPEENRKILSKPTIVLGGINANTVHAVKTEEYLKGKDINDETIAEALKIMSAELVPSVEPLHATPKYRRELACNLLYKTLLEIYKPTQYKLQSGGDHMERPLSFGLASFQEKTEEFPLKQALPKKTAPLQASGEAEYVNDIPTFQQELAAAVVVSQISCGTIASIDPAAALAIKGVIRFIGSADIPKDGVNNFFPPHPAFAGLAEELFATKDITHGGMLLGIVLAETAGLAEEGARKVKVTYTNVQKPIVEIEDAIAKNSIFEAATVVKTQGDAEDAMKKAHMVIEGEVKEATQAHFYMESQVSLSVPSEDGIDVYCTTQWADFIQRTVAQVLSKPLNFVNVTVPRLGGSFGGKVFQSAPIAAASSLAAYVTGKPVRLNIDLSSNMKFASRRFPILFKYKAGCDEKGNLLAVILEAYVDNGCMVTPMTVELHGSCDQGYYVPNWKYTQYAVKTHKTMHSACRGPGSLPGSLIIETIMEHFAKERNMNPILFKEMNLYENGNADIEGTVLEHCTAKLVWNRLKQVGEIEARMEDVKRFNTNNLWRKRGLTMCAVKYKIAHVPMGFPTNVSIFAGDGTVTVITSGIEMGQGVYMKIAQAVAKTLGVPIDAVKVRPNQNNLAPNGWITGGSTTSEACVHTAIQACQNINARLEPLKAKMPAETPWIQLINYAVFNSIPLYENTHVMPPGGNLTYFTYMAGATETEVDILTGEFQIKRVDIMADFGDSMNPTIDLGQVEGAYVMGLGACLSEALQFDAETGMVMNDGTWEYKPPTTKDIPIDWRIHFLPDSPNPVGICSSKATGEPPIGLSVGALLGIKQAVENAREELTSEKVFLPVSAPFTPEITQQGVNLSLNHLRFNGLSDKVSVKM